MGCDTIYITLVTPLQTLFAILDSKHCKVYWYALSGRVLVNFIQNNICRNLWSQQ